MRLACLLLIAPVLIACDQAPVPMALNGPIDDWQSIGKTPGGQRFSALTQINRDNVSQLKVAWEHRSGDYSTGTEQHGPTALQVTPLVVDGSLYYCTPYNRVFALDAESGAERWHFDPHTDLRNVYTPTCRGLAYWAAQTAGSDRRGICTTRIFTGTLDARLLALDAQTGEACADFGASGAVDLRDGLGDVRKGEYYMTSPPVVLGDLVIAGAFVQDGQRTDAPGGAVRAFDARSGALVWVWDPVPPGDRAVTVDDLRAGATLTRGTPNAWGLLSVDSERKLVFVPTGNPSPDHYGGRERANLDYYGTSFVALHGETGQLAWHFQAVHHDLWDYDIAAQPVTFTQRGGRDAVIGATKTGAVFILDRITGEPLFPVEERLVPPTDVAGEYSSPTQPFPVLPPPLHPQAIVRDRLWGLTPWDRNDCRQRFDALHYDGIYTPPSRKGTLAYPGLGGGINWGSVSVDPRNQRMVVNVQVVPFTMRLVDRDTDAPIGGDQVGYNPQHGTPYSIVRGAFLSKWQTPCVPPPWGRLAAVDLNNGAILWERPLGTLKGLAPFGDFFEWGTPNSGGSIQTGSDLVFIGATMDKYLRAFDANTGEELWRYALPYAAHATPVTYRVSETGRQYLVIAAGGHGALGTEPGDALIAFALPDGRSR